MRKEAYLSSIGRCKHGPQDTHLDEVQGQVGPVQAVACVVEVQGDGGPQAGEWQLLGGARGQVVAVDGLPRGKQDELVLLCTDTERERGLCILAWFSHTPRSRWHTRVDRGSRGEHGHQVAGGLGHISHLGRLLKLLWILQEFLLRHVCHLLFSLFNLDPRRHAPSSKRLSSASTASVTLDKDRQRPACRPSGLPTRTARVAPPSWARATRH